MLAILAILVAGCRNAGEHSERMPSSSGSQGYLSYIFVGWILVDWSNGEPGEMTKLTKLSGKLEAADHADDTACGCMTDCSMEVSVRRVSMSVLVSEPVNIPAE